MKLDRATFAAIKLTFVIVKVSMKNSRYLPMNTKLIYMSFIIN